MPEAMSNGYNHLYQASDHPQERDSLLTPSPVAPHQRHSSGPSLTASGMSQNGDTSDTSATPNTANSPQQEQQQQQGNSTHHHHETNLHLNDPGLLYHHGGHTQRHINNHQHPIGPQAAWNQMHSMAAAVAAHGNPATNGGAGNQLYDSGNLFTIDSPPSTLVLATMKKTKRQPQPIPDNCKDDAYWERRKRNNESAKKSREMRRWKEQQTTFRVKVLEQENLKLKTEVTMLRNELENFRKIICNERRDNISDAESNEHKVIT